eukprot:CAMPEP_0119147784 /NCGR_PEP_ID=MMETSP1310-20130426/40879_1 /TAXON_ID=464262 /ORGANISM="Genus nov. species nov., Strain RCC2339" /LENGTH=118 /DNA_ID=CAMNT_0007139775 /DNA_START=1 /DNA_END=354 /DNA_ORIENTATION=+
MGSYNDLYCTTGDGLLVQELLAGEEYSVNFVSTGGRHYLTDAQRYDKGPCFRILQTEWVVPDPAVVQYGKRVLDVLGVREGASHLEIMVTLERGPVLVELNARIAGGSTSLVSQKAIV